MKPKQEPKYRAVAPHYPENDGLAVQWTEGHLVNRASGEAIPDDEPVFVFRARDKHAAETLLFYRDLCQDPDHRAVIDRRINDFVRFADQHPERMKEPDTEPNP